MSLAGRLSEAARNLRAIRRPADLVLLARMIRFARQAPTLARAPLEDLDLRARPRSVRPDPTAAGAVERLLPLALNLVRRRDCLPRGLTGYRYLRSYGMPVELVFGVRGGDPPGAHCWLELDHKPYLESGEPRSVYTVMHVIGGDRGPAL